MAEDRERSRRRARGRLRRYAVANRCTRLVTLTWAVAARDRAEVVEAAGEFQRALRDAGYGQAWVRVVERGSKGTHRLHLHYGFSRPVPHADLERLWGRGFVWINAKVRGGRGGREDARLAAAYLAKYATKEAIAAPGEHSYEVAQGYPVIPLEVEYATLAQLEELLTSRHGAPAYRWASAEDPTWRGPPVSFWSW